MRALLVSVFLLAATSAGAATTAHGQDGGTPSAVDTDVHVDPETGERFRWVRPTDPMRRGPLSVPGWIVIAGGAVVALAAVALLVRRARR